MRPQRAATTASGRNTENPRKLRIAWAAKIARCDCSVGDERAGTADADADPEDDEALEDVEEWEEGGEPVGVDETDEAPEEVGPDVEAIDVEDGGALLDEL